MQPDKNTIRNIFLIGMMGSGKSTIGPALARRLGRAFADTDAIIESKGKTIAEIFDQQGEDAFRLLESAVLEDLCKKEGLVIATGGGLPVWHDGMAKMKAHGQVVYLRVNCLDLAKRLASNPGERPLLDLTSSQLEHKLASLLEEREKIYLEADIVIDNDRDINLTLKDLSSIVSSD